ASPGLVVLGSVRVISSLATRLRPEEGLVLGGSYVGRWGQLRAELEKRRRTRRQQRRFRRDPITYLKQLEELALQLLQVRDRVSSEAALLASRPTTFLQLGTQLPPPSDVAAPQDQPFLGTQSCGQAGNHTHRT